MCTSLSTVSAIKSTCIYMYSWCYYIIVSCVLHVCGDSESTGSLLRRSWGSGNVAAFGVGVSYWRRKELYSFNQQT